MQSPAENDPTAGASAGPPPSILVPQVISMALIWVFVIGIAAWIINLIDLSIQLDDAPGATVVISLIAIPIFFTLAGILTYVFVGLQKEERRLIREGRTE
jgi:hypothetical protein